MAIIFSCLVVDFFHVSLGKRAGNLTDMSQFAYVVILLAKVMFYIKKI